MPGVQVPGSNLPYGQLELPASQTRPLPWPEKWTGLKWTLLQTVMPHGPRGPAGPLSGSEGSQGGGWRAHLQVGDHPKVIIITIKTTSGLWEAPTLSSGRTRRPKAEHFTFLIAFNPHFTSKESEAQRG